MQIDQKDFFVNMVFFMASNAVCGFNVPSPLEFRGLLTIEWE